MRQAAIQRRNLFMTADTFAILCTIAPFAILLIGVTHPGLRKKHLRKKFTVIRNSSVKSKHKKRVTKSAKPKYKLKDLNNVDLTKGYVDACWEELSSKK